MPDAEARPLSRRERRKLELRARILEAGLALFDARGPQATTVAEICARADVAHKAFFNHFPSKQHLLRAIAEQSIDELLVDMEALSKRPAAPHERIERFFALVVRRAEEAGPMHRELLTEMLHAAHASGTEARHARRLATAFESLVGEGAEGGGRDVRTLTEMVQGAFYVLMFNWANLEGYPLRARARAAARFLAGAIGDGERRSSRS
jgi:AcrR family transcriptional regulator